MNARNAKEVLAQLWEEPHVDDSALEAVHDWVSAVGHARGRSFGHSDATWQDDKDTVALSGYIGMQRDKLARGGAWAPLLTPADVKASVADTSDKGYLQQIYVCLERTAEHHMGGAWPAALVATDHPRELFDLYSTVRALLGL